MLETLTRILARRADDLLRRVTGREAGEFETNLEPVSARNPEKSPRSRYELAAAIDFEGALCTPEGPGAPVGGYMICGACKNSEVQPFLAAMTAHIGLDPAILKTQDGPLNILSEFLNILIGLAAADWAERGFETNFSTPRDLSGRSRPAPAPGDRLFHISAGDPGSFQVDIVVVFNEKNFA